MNREILSPVESATNLRPTETNGDSHLQSLSNSVESSSETYRILIVDDHPLVRDGLISLITHHADLEVCGEAEDAITALKFIEQLKPDVAIVDISLKNGNGLDLVKRLKSHGTKTKLLVLSMHDEYLYAERAIRAGAMGFINKQSARRSIIKAIRHVLAGNIYVSEEMSERMLNQSVSQANNPEVSPVERLSDRELAVFEFLGQGVPPREISKTLKISTKTVETYRDHIKKKLNLNSSGELNRFAIEWSIQKHGVNNNRSTSNTPSEE